MVEIEYKPRGASFFLKRAEIDKYERKCTRNNIAQPLMIIAWPRFMEGTDQGRHVLGVGVGVVVVVVVVAVTEW